MPHEHVFGDPMAEAEERLLNHNQLDENEQESRVVTQLEEAKVSPPSDSRLIPR